MSNVRSKADRQASCPTASAKPVSHGVMGRLRNYFLTGLILVGPVYITVNLTWWFINWVDDLVRPFIPIAYRPETYLPIKIPGTGLIIALVALTLLGFLTANLVGRTLVEFGETILNRMPVVRPIYKSLKQIFETLFSKTGSSFRRVALVEFPSPGHVVAGVSVAAGEPGDRGEASRHRARRGLHAVHAQPDHRLLLLRAAPRPHRARHLGRGGDDAPDVGRHGAARRQRSAEAARALAETARAAQASAHGRTGEVSGDLISIH